MVFGTMGAIFGERFTSRFPTSQARIVGKRTWGNALRDLADAQVAWGLEKCSDWKDKFAPTLPEFRDLCKDKSGPVSTPKPAQIQAPSMPRMNAELSEAMKLIKKLFFAEEHWSTVYKQVSEKYTELKNMLKVSMPNASDLELVLKVKKMLQEELA